MPSIEQLNSRYWFCTKMLMITVLIGFIGKVMSDIRRYDDGYEADFRVINKGRLYPTLMYFENIDYKECLLHCIRHLKCVSFNYNFDIKECELADEGFDEYEADTDALYWLNFGTPQRIDGGFSDWINDSCSAKCGGGVRNQFRTCTNPEPKFGGDKCIGKMSRTIVCNNHPCPIDGGLSDWIDSSCSVTCGGGFLTQTKTCTNPVPQYGGTDCVGDKQRTLTCNSQPCPPPINGQWTQWTRSGSCSKGCDVGRQTYKRYCTNPSPQHGGADCPGSNTRTTSCNIHCCSKRSKSGTCCATVCFMGCIDIYGNLVSC